MDPPPGRLHTAGVQQLDTEELVLAPGQAFFLKKKKKEAVHTATEASFDSCTTNAHTNKQTNPSDITEAEKKK